LYAVLLACMVLDPGFQFLEVRSQDLVNLISCSPS
jgi:hypothetical protein